MKKATGIIQSWTLRLEFSFILVNQSGRQMAVRSLIHVKRSCWESNTLSFLTRPYFLFVTVTLYAGL